MEKIITLLLVPSVFKQDILGTWVTENGAEKLLIGKKSLVYIAEDLDPEYVENYIIEDVSYNNESSYQTLKPAKDNESKTLGLFEEIKHINGSLIGCLMIHDLEYRQTEFRRHW